MLELKRYEGKSKEEAIEKCLSELNVKEEDLYLRYGETEAKLFKAKKYYVEALTKEEVIQFLKDYIAKIAQGMKIEIHNEIKEVDYNKELVLVNNKFYLLIINISFQLPVCQDFYVI